MKLKRNNRRSVRRQNMSFETMEDRKMFAADFISTARLPLDVSTVLTAPISYISLHGDVVTATGTSADNVITIDNDASPQYYSPKGKFNNGFSLSLPKVRFTVENASGELLETKAFPRSFVSNFIAYGAQGNDLIINNTSMPGVMWGGAGDDTIVGGSGRDTVYGGYGNDTITGNGGHDIVRGNAGNDRIFGNSGNDSLQGDEGNDELYGHAGNDSVMGGDGNDRMWGSDGADRMWGGDGNDVIWGQDDNDLLIGDDGDDTVLGGNGDDYLYGSDDDDTLSGEQGNDHIYGNNGNDVLRGHSGNDTLSGGSGNDELSGGSGRDSLFGGNNDDTLEGDSGNDTLRGGSGRDNLYGGSGNDALFGGSGDDGLYGGTGTDGLTGDSGDDRFLVLNDIETGFWFWSGLTTADTIHDRHSNDAKINFQHGEGRTFDFDGLGDSIIEDGTFTAAEIQEVDQSLKDLHHKTGNTKLLKTADGDELTFERLGAQTGGSFALAGVNSGGSLITLLDATFDGSDDSLSQTIFHEIGHNWDNENEDWDEWKGISGWRESSRAGYTQSGDGNWWYRNGTDFARDYGKSNPKEDFATYFAKVMMDDTARSYSGSGDVNATKEDFFDAFFASLV